MSHVRVSKGGETKIRTTVPIAVTPEGFWCCPSPVVFQKNNNLKTHTHHINKSKHPPSPPPRPPPQPPASAASVCKKQSPSLDKISSRNPTNFTPSDDQKSANSNTTGSPAVNVGVADERSGRSKVAENLPKKVSLEFGESGTSDMKVVLIGKHGFSVKLNVHKSVLVEKSSFFAEKLGEQESDVASLKIFDCDDIDIYVETVGLMYSKDVKHRLLKQSVERVLRILKVAEILGFSSCIQTCLDYLEAAPWVGEEEEEKVVSSVMRLQSEGIGGGVNPVLKRVSSKTASKPPKDTLSHILELVLKSNEERGRREMKSIVLKLLRENSCSSDTDNSPDLCYETINASCRSCLDSLVAHFQQATGPEYSGRSMDSQDPLAKLIAIKADNLAWLLEILTERQVADEFALMWVCQQELASLHQKLPTMIRYHVSCITARLFVGIGRGELLPSKETRHMLLQTWLEPLTNDYSWLNHGCRSFDRKVVEEGIGRTILTLPLEDQQSILLSWLSTFLKSGDNCPNLQRAFEVWWRRTFIRPYAEPRVNQG